MYSTPRRTDNECISLKRFYLEEVLVDELEPRWVFLVNCEVVTQHLQLVRVDVIYDILLEVIEEVDCYSADAAEGLEYTRDLPTLEPLAQIK